jgi:hypothetical protein
MMKGPDPVTLSGPVKGYWKVRFSIVSWWPVPLGTPPARAETGQAGAAGEVRSLIGRGYELADVCGEVWVGEC